MIRSPEYSRREFLEILKNNGYVLKRSTGGHEIYESTSTGKSLTIPSRKLNRMLTRRLIKEFELKV